MRSVFINYRRHDSEGEAGRLFDELILQFSSEAVFMDVAAIEPGRDFRKAIDQNVASCSVLLAVIGQDWLDACDAEGRRRLDDPNDFVRIELASALHRNIVVIPVLVRGARMPQADQLPDDLRELAFRNAVELTHARWKSDVQVLLHALRPHLDAPDAAVNRANSAQPAAVPLPQSGEKLLQSSQGLEPVTAQRVARELAAYIGPVAELVVKRAAKQCASAEDLYAAVSREIKVESDRLRFLRACRS